MAVSQGWSHLPWPHVLHLIMQCHAIRGYDLLHFAQEEAEAQKSQVTCPRSLQPLCIFAPAGSTSLSVLFHLTYGGYHLGAPQAPPPKGYP